MSHLSSPLKVTPTKRAPDHPPEHSAIVRFRRVPGELSKIFDLELALALALAKTGTGWYEGHELTADRTSGQLYMYGNDADELFATIRPVLERATGICDVVALLRYGDADDDAPRVSVVIEPQVSSS